MRRNQILQAAGLREMKFIWRQESEGAKESKKEKKKKKRARIIETGRVQLGREIEMLSPSPPYHHQSQCAAGKKNQLKSQNINMWSYAEYEAAERKSTRCPARASTRTHRGEEKKAFCYFSLSYLKMTQESS